jgi:hypothetical protein
MPPLKSNVSIHMVDLLGTRCHAVTADHAPMPPEMMARRDESAGIIRGLERAM